MMGDHTADDSFKESLPIPRTFTYNPQIIGLFDPSAVERLIDDHLHRKRDNRQQLWTLFVVEWHDGYAGKG